MRLLAESRGVRLSLKLLARPAMRIASAARRMSASVSIEKPASRSASGMFGVTMRATGNKSRLENLKRLVADQIVSGS